MTNMFDIIKIGAPPAPAERGLGKILHPALFLMIRQPPVHPQFVTRTVRQIPPHGRDRKNLPGRNAAIHQRAGNQRANLFFIVAVAVFLIELIHQCVQRHGFPHRRNGLAHLFIRNGFQLGVIHHRQYGRSARQLFIKHLLQVRLPGFIRAGRIQ